MISRELKSLYYSVARVPMAVSSRAYRALRAPRTNGTDVKVHLGPGQRNYLDGWINVDANIVSSKPDVWSDLRDVLPFRDESVSVFYSHHVIEHLPDALLPFHMREMFRCLKPGGLIRIGGPNGDAAIERFSAGDSAWFGDFPDSRTSIGGRFTNFILCAGEHLTILTYSYLHELLGNAGFVEITRCRPGLDTVEPRLIDAQVFAKEPEPTPDMPHTLLVEARKPVLRS
jgi:predicted SAM-dependent methyltransferase